MIDFQKKLKELENSLIDNIGTGKDSILEHQTLPKNKEPLEKEIKISTPEPIKNEPSPIESTPLQLLEQRVLKLEEKFNNHPKSLTKESEKTDCSLPKENEEETLFISMVNIYLYSVIINPKLYFKNPIFESYKENLLLISQNILANSFRFFEKDSILIKTMELGDNIIKEYPHTQKSIQEVKIVLNTMQQNLLKPSYQKNFYFAKLLNERGLILNSIAIINEILGEYILESAKQLSSHANDRIQVSLERINGSQTARRGYYHLYKSASGFFYTHFSPNSTEIESSFFPYKDTGNEEIEIQMKKIFQSNKRSKRDLFTLYTNLIYRIRIIRNDLVHGNNQRHFHNISYEIEDVLIDFEYLAIQKNFLNA